ncbi:hypothetical protein BDV32DRAFT_64330 [Aspergillus pseudonomiae]|uniref:Uncharacterized protein n=1 Tax=Aspergillus pseudonomiae TaxID=1506151 RepID=A0A5N6HXJ3_9EURO|nr:uncharacterized protein BDV37DRAFT_205497 [Aspergillus pseudonomiae]KAB8258988.1 hypothetical protein BDV32DRAFT_64330 [Aspergillus pseudonomiae]KAE8407943.1 hypothetical protein BDV37DRAFT_205497 [Aspergillus pseudonomiae]
MSHSLGLPWCSVPRSCFSSSRPSVSCLIMIDDRHGPLEVRWCRAHSSRFVSSTLVSLFSIGMFFTISVDVIWAWQEFYSEERVFGSIICSRIGLVLHCMLELLNFWFFLERLCMYLRIVFAIFPFHHISYFCSLLESLDIPAYPNRTAAYSPHRSTIRNRRLLKDTEIPIVLQWPIFLCSINQAFPLFAKDCFVQQQRAIGRYY